MIQTLLVLWGIVLSSAAWAEPLGFFAADERRQAFAEGRFAEGRTACLAIERDPQWISMIPIGGLKARPGYGTDRAAQSFDWAMMVLSSRALAGDLDAGSDLRLILSKWAASAAFTGTEPVNDAYFALQRTLLPVIAAYSVARNDLGENVRRQVADWITVLVGKIDTPAGRDLDSNNHRILTDSILASWGTVSGDDAMYQRGLAGLQRAFAIARDDGSLPFETGRGSRAAWYTRQTLTSMFLIAEAAAAQGLDPYRAGTESGGGLRRTIAYLAEIVVEPDIVLAYSAENDAPGPETDFAKPDLGFLDAKPMQRDYLAFLDIAGLRMGDSLGVRRLLAAVERRSQRGPARLDEFAGGNVPCFWGAS